MAIVERCFILKIQELYADLSPIPTKEDRKNRKIFGAARSDSRKMREDHTEIKLYQLINHLIY